MSKYTVELSLDQRAYLEQIVKTKTLHMLCVASL